MTAIEKASLMNAKMVEEQKLVIPKQDRAERWDKTNISSIIDRQMSSSAM